MTTGEESYETLRQMGEEMQQLRQDKADLLAALEALAKCQYDGTVEGLREQMRTEDWGDVLAIEETKAAYELTLDVLAHVKEVQYD